MGSPLRAARQKASHPHRHVWFLSFPNRRCHWQRPANSPSLSFLRWTLWRLPARCRRCCILGHVRQSHTWSCHHSLLHDRLHRPAPRTVHRRLHHPEPQHGLALDRVHCGNHGLPSLWPRSPVPRRNIPSGRSCRESLRTPPPNEELGYPCQTRGDRGRLPRTPHQEL